jgi:hypothetical protein
MRIEISNSEIALLNSLIAVRMLELQVNFDHCSAIQDSTQQKAAKAMVKSHIKELEILCEKVNAHPEGCGEAQTDWR